MMEKLRTAKGKQGGSLISMLLPGKKAIAEYTKKLADEIGKANNIQDRVNRQSVQSALKAVIEKLKTYGHKTPKNGLVIYFGEVMKEDGKTITMERICFEPFKPLNQMLSYMNTCRSG